MQTRDDLILKHKKELENHFSISYEIIKWGRGDVKSLNSFLVVFPYDENYSFDSLLNSLNQYLEKGQ